MQHISVLSLFTMEHLSSTETGWQYKIKNWLIQRNLEHKLLYGPQQQLWGFIFLLNRIHFQIRVSFISLVISIQIWTCHNHKLNMEGKLTHFSNLIQTNQSNRLKPVITTITSFIFEYWATVKAELCVSCLLLK